MAKNEEKDTKESKKEPETKEPDETTKATPDDPVIEKILIEEEPKTEQPDETLLEVTVREKGIRPETKTAFGALILLSLSLLFLWITTIFDNIMSTDDFFGFFFVSVVIGFFLCIVTVRFVAWDKNQRDFLAIPLILLWCIFVLPLFIGKVPLSKYHNYNQLERDKKIAEILKITVLKDQIEVLLPSEHASENSYLKKVFSFGFDAVDRSWKDIVIPYREGDKYWYKVNLPFPNWYKWKLTGHSESWTTAEEEKKYNSNTDNIVLFFDHAFVDYKTTKEITFPDPDPNSL